MCGLDFFFAKAVFSNIWYYGQFKIWAGLMFSGTVISFKGHYNHFERVYNIMIFAVWIKKLFC